MVYKKKTNRKIPILPTEEYFFQKLQQATAIFAYCSLLYMFHLSNFFYLLYCKKTMVVVIQKL
jgi:hypothetical protein